MKLTEIQAKLKERVAKGLNFGIEAVEEVIDPSSDLYNEFVLLKSKYNDLMYISTMNTLPYEQIEIGLNRLRANVLDIIDKIESLGLKKAEVESDLKIQALPTRRDNFFKLLDIHFKNLEGISFVEISGSSVTDRQTGRPAIHKYYQMLTRPYRNVEQKDNPEIVDKIKESFSDYFKNEVGVFDVYFKNIQHLLGYTLDSEIEQKFFLNTIRSLFTRFELGLIFYYALCDINPAFSLMVRKAGLIGADIKSVLISESHFNYLDRKANPTKN